MCGIAGIVRLGRGPALDRDEVVEAMTGRLVHRGPDDRTSWRAPSGRCLLGHTRLGVIDLETGDQPMPNEDGSVQVVFNGEVYNFRELRRELEVAGHAFRSRSDTEVIVHGYEAWGDDVVHRLDGMFAFGLWDEARGRLLLARDRAGKKPLFTARLDDRLLFASEIGALLEAPGVSDALDPAAVPLYLAYGYVPSPGTFYRAVRKVAPATLVTVESDGGVEERRYWRLDFSARSTGAAAAKAELRGLLRDAVERRLVADVPLGAFLSGGIDSTVVVGLMSELTDGPVRTFSIGFADDPTYDETAFARLASERYGTDHTEFTVEAQSLELVDDLLDAYGEPFGDSSAIPTYVVSRLTREHVTVALTGDGGDELFAGYLRFLGARIAEAMPGWVVAAGRRVGSLLPHHPDFRSLPRRFQRFFDAAGASPEERWLRWIGFFADRLEEVLRPEVAGEIGREAIARHFREPVERNAHLPPVARALALNFETYLPEDLLVKADRCSMAHGLELRSPFLDTRLMEYAASLPDRLRIRRGTLKWILREAFAERIPPEILKRGKMGFGVPLPAWFRGPWRPLLEERVLADDARIRRWVRPEPIREMARHHLEERADFGHQLWALLTLEEWLRRGRYSLPG